ncbi:hypothetical protein L208DRAFT_1406036 [Tricholoma matsutake]|nr:hypothetical protein L208DRAFT_1406036 [Tricholoma matsutake 945]
MANHKINSVIVEANLSQEKLWKPVMVNWRDIRAMINQSPTKSHHAMAAEDQNDNDSCDENEILTPVDPEADPLRWLDDGIPDLSGFEHRYFDLAAQFDISHYIDILADSVSDGTTASNFTQSTQLSGAMKNYGKDKDSEAGDFAPEDNEWGQWS